MTLQEKIERGAIAMARFNYYGRNNLVPFEWPPGYRDASKQRCRNVTRVILTALEETDDV